MCGHTCASAMACSPHGGQRTTWANEFSPSFDHVGPRVELQWSGLITCTYNLGVFLFSNVPEFVFSSWDPEPSEASEAGADREGLSYRTQGLSAPSLRGKESLAGMVDGVGGRAWESVSSRKFQPIKMPAPGRGFGWGPIDF